MKRNEIIKYVTSAEMPDIEQVRVKCLNQRIDEAEQKNKSNKIQRPYLKMLVPAMLILMLLLGAGAYYVEYIIIESGTAGSMLGWSDDITVNGATIQVEMKYYTAFTYNSTDKTVEMTKEPYYDYSSSDGKADNYFSDIKITNNYTESSFLRPAKYTSTLTFKCNGKPVSIELYQKSDGKGGNIIKE